MKETYGNHPQVYLALDDVRQENTGKLIIIGLYTPDISAASIPATLPTLSFVQVLDSDRPGQYTFRVRLTHLESGHQVAEAMGMINFVRPGMGVSVVKFGGLVFDRLGTYNLILTLEDHADPILFSFNVILAPQFQQPQR
jgi:hypothetical protein